MKRQVFFYTGFIALSAVFILLSAIIGHLVISNGESIFTAAEQDNVCIVIDAGHGGEDGGCVSDDGVLEKELNLSVSEKITEILRAMGYNTIMTRTGDEMLYDMYGDDYSGKKKTYDLKNRLRFARENEADVFVSIHMNKFPQSKYSGLQVYYSDNHADSKLIADTIQSYCRAYLQKDNERVTKAADSAIYLLDRIELPGVLVECGFLSNAEETERLCDEEYQKELSFTVASAVMEYFES